jgi:hypothetical protein
MAQLNDSNVFVAGTSPFGAPTREVALAAAVSDRAADPVAIFSAPDVVFHWWAESKRRWAEQDRARTLAARPIARVANEAGDDGH